MNQVFYKTSTGILQVTLENNHILTALFTKESEPITSQLNASLPCILRGTPFQVQVWQAAMKIPAGSTITYQELAITIGRPKAFRAVANALGQNKIAYFIPCHRVVRKNKCLGGYKWGVEIKRELLRAEGIAI